MITGKQLRDARKRKEMTVAQAAKVVGISANTLSAWEGSKEVKVRNKAALSKLLTVYGLSTAEKLAASLPKKTKTKKGATSKRAKKSRMPAWLMPKGVPRPLVIGVGGGGGGGDEHGPADVSVLVQMLGFFMSDQARRSNLGLLLKAATRCGLTIHGLERAIDGNG